MTKETLSAAPAFEGAELRRLAAGLYLAGLGRALVKEVATILAPGKIPVMPLKGVLLQQLVYAEKSGRPAEGVRTISDVDLLVPVDRFEEAHTRLHEAGFTENHWEGGRWQVAMRRPGGPLFVDLHHRLSRTVRGELDAKRLFAAATLDATLFGAEVHLPRPEDAFAHLILHASLHWMNRGTLHHPEDFVSVPRVLALDPQLCAEILGLHGLTRHTRLVFSLFADEQTPFMREVLAALGRHRREQVRVHLLRALGPHTRPGSLPRRAVSLLLAPSLSRSLLSALRDRWKVTERL